MTTADSADDASQSIARALGRVPSGAYILTARHGERAMVMMASWVQQAAFEPPAVSIALAKGRAIGELIHESKRLALSILAKNDRELMKRYSRGVKPGEDPFAGVRIVQTPAGLPVLADSLAFLECTVISICDFGGDHELIVARVDAGKQFRKAEAFTHQRVNGFRY